MITTIASYSRKLSTLLGFFCFGLLYLIPAPATGQYEFILTGGVNEDGPYPFCDTIIFHFDIKNTGSASAFEGWVRFRLSEWDIIDLSELPDIDPEIAQEPYNHSFFHFTTPVLQQDQQVTYSYKLVVKAQGVGSYNTYHEVTRIANDATAPMWLEITPSAYFAYSIPSPGTTDIRASELVGVFASGLMPLEPPPGNPAFYACNPQTTQKFRIIDQLIFDIPEYCIYNFDNTGEILVEGGGQIIVESGARLYINGQTIRSCKQMWKGFYVEAGGHLVLSYCTIKNAQYGIFAEQGATVTLVGNTFEDCYISFYSVPQPVPHPDPNAPVPPYVLVPQFAYNTFTGSGAMLPPYDGQFPVPPDDYPYAGVYVAHQYPFIMTSQPHIANYFSNMYNGVIALNSTLFIKEAYFHDMVYDPQAPEGISGNGIYVDNCPMATIENIHNGESGLGGYHFDNCRTGIYNSKSGLRVSGSTMHDVNEGIHATRVHRRNVHLEDNIIHTPGKGIVLNHCLPSHGRVLSNQVWIPSGVGDESIGIEINDLPTHVGWTVENNFIYLGDGAYAIANTAGFRNRIVSNEVYKDYFTEDDGIGIFLQGAKYPVVRCNLLIGDIIDANYHNSRGIYLHGAHGFDVSCNEISHFRYGLYAAGDNSSGSKLQGNTFGYGWIGLHLNENGIIGEQSHGGNIWNHTFAEKGAKHLGLPEIVAWSKFYYDPNDNPDFEPPSVFASTRWFYDVGGTSFECDIEELCPNDVGNIPFITTWTQLDKDLIDGDLGFAHFDRPVSWTGRFHTYHRLKRLSPLSLDAGINTWIAAQQTQNIGKFSTALDSISSGLSYYGGSKGVIDSFPGQFSAVTGQIGYLDSLMADDILNDSLIALIRLQYDTALYHIHAYFQADSVLKDIAANKLKITRNFIQAISPDSAWQEALKLTLLHAVNLVNTDTLTTAGKNALEDLAMSCPELYGDAVFHARSLVRQFSGTVKYDDATLCDSLVSRSVVGNTGPAARVFPNPASSMVSVLKDAEKQVQSCSVFNTAGRQMPLEWVEHSDRIILHVNRLPAGMYIVRIDYMDGFVTTDRFVITE